MKNRIKSLLMVAIVFCSATLLLVGVTSCKDEWNDHYESNNSGRTFEGTIMEYLKSQRELSDFVEIVEKSDFDIELASSQMYTLWAPVNGAFNKDSLISIINADRKYFVVKEFIKNHMTRYNVSCSELEDTKKVSLLNAKFTQVTANKLFGHANILESNISCKNGIVHKIDHSHPYQANLYEQIENAHMDWLAEHHMEEDDSMISLYTFLKAYNADSLDPNKSVERGIDEKGQKVYVDSVMIRNNTILNSIDAMLYEEDSSYTILIPTVEAYQERYNIAREYLVYNPSENIVDPKMCDSLAHYYANMFAITDLFFNDNYNKNYLTLGDSIMSTTYRKTNWENHVYYHPYEPGGIFSYGKIVEASNGKAYLVDKYPLSVTDQFYKKIDVSCPTTRNIDQTTNKSGKPAYTKDIDTSFPSYFLNVSTDDYEVQTSFLDIKPINSNNPAIGFKVYDTLKGNYDIYLVYCPIWVNEFKTYEDAKVYSDSLKAEVEKGASASLLKNDPLRPYYFKATIWERDNKGSNIGLYPSKGTDLTDPVSRTKNFTTNVENYVDTLFLGTYATKNAYYKTNGEGVLIQFQPNITSTKTSTYSREMFFCKVIFKPHAEEPTENSVKFRKR